MDMEIYRKRYFLGEPLKQRDDLWFISSPQDQLVPLLTDLKRHGGFTHLVLLTAVDRIEENQFQLTYLLHNREKKLDLGVTVRIDRETAAMESIHHLWEQAATYQRELFEMFGISFPGSPRMTEPFILEGWQDKPPYRRDFDTKKYAEETFAVRPGRGTNDPAEYMKNKIK